MAALLVWACAGCAVSQKTKVKPSEAPRPAQTATKAQLIDRYDDVARGVTSLNATVTMKLTAGSAYSGVIEQYHEVNGFILAARPASIRVIGQAPVVAKNIFDMVSDGKTFHIYIPSKNKFIEGPANFEKRADKPAENLRPQHLVDALFWPEITENSTVLFEEEHEATSRYYVLTVILQVEGSESGATSARTRDWEVARKIWFDRADLSVSRVEIYDPQGEVSSDISYSDWQPAGTASYARQIAVARPADDYALRIAITKLSVNEPVSPDRFVLAQPPGAEVVRVGEPSKEAQP
ncbi:MAG: hypothetical protein WBX12_04075 [Candidatus Acidiferrales bacterium]